MLCILLLLYYIYFIKYSTCIIFYIFLHYQLLCIKSFLYSPAKLFFFLFFWRLFFCKFSQKGSSDLECYLNSPTCLTLAWTSKWLNHFVWLLRSCFSLSLKCARWMETGLDIECCECPFGSTCTSIFKILACSFEWFFFFRILHYFSFLLQGLQLYTLCLFWISSLFHQVFHSMYLSNINLCLLFYIFIFPFHTVFCLHSFTHNALV